MIAGLPATQLPPWTRTNAGWGPSPSGMSTSAPMSGNSVVVVVEGGRVVVVVDGGRVVVVVLVEVVVELLAVDEVESLTAVVPPDSPGEQAAIEMARARRAGKLRLRLRAIRPLRRPLAAGPPE